MSRGTFLCAVFVIAFFHMLCPCGACSEPDWVKQLTAEASAVSAPKEASLVVLRYIEDVEVNESPKAMTKVQYAIKVLTKEGSNQATYSHVVSPLVRVTDLKCWIIKPDSSVRTMSKDNIVKVDKSASAGYYDDKATVIARPSFVERGDIVAFDVELEETGLPCLVHSFIFQIQQPVRLARFSLTVPASWEVHYGGWRTEGIDFQRKGNTLVWTARDLQYQPDEPLAPSWQYLSRRLNLACNDPDPEATGHFADWRSVARWLVGEFATPSAVSDDIAVQASRITEGKQSTEEKARAIAEFVQKEVRYVAVEIGKNRWQPRAAATTLYNRFGDCKDKSTLMVSLLRSIGIEAVPVLCNTTYPVDPRVPTPFQFDHCIVGIHTWAPEEATGFADAAVGDWLLFDPTSESTLLGQIPEHLQTGWALLGADTDSVLHWIAHPDPDDYRRMSSARAVLNSDGSFSAQVMVTDQAGLAPARRHWLSVTPEKDQIALWVSALTASVPAVSISDYKISDGGDSVSVSFSITGKHYAQETGGLHILRPNFLVAAAPPDLTAKARELPIWFGSPREEITEIAWELPPGLVAEAETTIIESQCAGGNISSRTEPAQNGLRLRTLYRRFGEIMPAEDYDAARGFSRAVSQVSGMAAVLQKR